MYCIYKVTNLVNGKQYVGKTNNFERRLNEHLRDKTDHLFSRALRKYGKDAFRWKVIEKGIRTNAAAGERERYWIKELNSFYRSPNSNGYNMTLGGDGGGCWNLRPVAAYSKEGELLKVFSTVTEAARHYGISGTSSISAVCDKDRTCAGMMFRYVEEDKPPIRIRPYRAEYINSRLRPACQLDTAGNLVHRYPSIAAAEKAGFRHTGIQGVLKGRYKLSQGFQWCYEENLMQKLDVGADEYEPFRNDKIVQLTREGQIVAEFASCADAARKIGATSNKNIHAVLGRTDKTAYGYRWAKKSQLSA